MSYEKPQDFAQGSDIKVVPMEFSQAGSDKLLTLWTSTVFTTKLLFYTFKNILHHQPQPGTPLHQKAATEALLDS